jgi:hypothetical protein
MCLCVYRLCVIVVVKPCVHRLCVYRLCVIVAVKPCVHRLCVYRLCLQEVGTQRPQALLL